MGRLSHLVATMTDGPGGNELSFVDYKPERSPIWMAFGIRFQPGDCSRPTIWPGTTSTLWRDGDGDGVVDAGEYLSRPRRVSRRSADRAATGGPGAGKTISSSTTEPSRGRTERARHSPTLPSTIPPARHDRWRRCCRWSVANRTCRTGASAGRTRRGSTSGTTRRRSDIRRPARSPRPFMTSTSLATLVNPGK